MERKQTLNFCSVPDHEDMQINMICLKASCKKPKLICAECFFSDHNDHKDKVITMKTLKNNKEVIEQLAEIANSSSNSASTNDRVNNIKSKFFKLRDFINSCLNEAEDRFEEMIGKFSNYEEIDFSSLSSNLCQATAEDADKVNKLIAILSDALEGNKEKLSIRSDYDPHKNFDKILEKMEKVVSQKVESIENTITSLKNGIEVKPIISSSQLVFSKEMLHNDIHLNSNQKEVTLHDVSGGGFKIAMIDLNLGELEEIKIKFLIKKKMSWIGLGIGIADMISDLKFKVTGHQKGSGLYLYSVNGYTWSHSNLGDENQKKTNFPSGDGDIILMHYVQPTATVCFYKDNVQIAKITGVETIGKSKLMPAVFLNGTGDSVKILDETD